MLRFLTHNLESRKKWRVLFSDLVWRMSDESRDENNLSPHDGFNLLRCKRKFPAERMRPKFELPEEITKPNAENVFPSSFICFQTRQQAK